MEECIFYDFWKDCLFSLNCVYDALFEILPKFNFESDLQGRNQATVGCWHNYLISISKWNWYSSLPRTFFIFQTEKYLLRSNLKNISSWDQIWPTEIVDTQLSGFHLLLVAANGVKGNLTLFLYICHNIFLHICHNISSYLLEIKEGATNVQIKRQSETQILMTSDKIVFMSGNKMICKT